MKVIARSESNLNTSTDTLFNYLNDSPELIRLSSSYQPLIEFPQYIFTSLTPEKSFDWKENQNAFQRLIHLADLPERWDGYTAPRFPRHQINRAIEIFQSLQDYSKKLGIDWQKIEPFIAPSSDGSILFEWSGQRFKQRNLEIYIPQELNHFLEYLKTDIALDNDTEGECQTSQVSDLLGWLLNI
jgi:hypothetical protein